MWLQDFNFLERRTLLQSSPHDQTRQAKATYPLQVVRSVMQQRPAEGGIFEQLGKVAIARSTYDPTQCLCCAFLLLHRSSTEARALRYTSVPRTTHLLWQRKGLPAFYRGLNDLQFWSMPGSTFAVLVQEYCRRWCELFLKPWPSSPSMSMHWLLWIFLEPSHRQLEHMSLDFIVLCIAHVLGLAEWSRAEQSCAQILRQLLGVSSNRCKDAWDGRSWDSHEPRKSMEYWIKMEYGRAFKWDWELVWQVRMTRWMCSWCNKPTLLTTFNQDFGTLILSRVRCCSEQKVVATNPWSTLEPPATSQDGASSWFVRKILVKKDG